MIVNSDSSNDSEVEDGANTANDTSEVFYINNEGFFSEFYNFQDIYKLKYTSKILSACLYIYGHYDRWKCCLCENVYRLIAYMYVHKYCMIYNLLHNIFYSIILTADYHNLRKLNKQNWTVEIS